MKTTGLYPRVQVDIATVPAVGNAGGVLLTVTRSAHSAAQLPKDGAPVRRGA